MPHPKAQPEIYNNNNNNYYYYIYNPGRKNKHFKILIFFLENEELEIV
jgi:hypothetical protein